MSFVGTYDCKIDVKGRLPIPAALKEQLLRKEYSSFVLKRAVFNECIEVYPMEEWDKLMKKMNSLNKFNKKNNDFIRRFTAGVKVVNLDSVFRLLIPKALCEFAGIEKEVVLSSAINIIEIWDKNKYEAVIEDTATDFVDLAEEVMKDVSDS